MNLNDLYEMRDPRDAYQRDVDNSTSGFGKDSQAYRADGGANDERHDLDPTEWYIVKDGKMFKATVYPNQEQQAISQGYSRTRDEAKSKVGKQGMAESVEDRTSYQVAKVLFDRGITYDPTREDALIKVIGMVLVKELNMSPKMAQGVMNDEDFLGDTMGELKHMEQSMAEGWKGALAGGLAGAALGSVAPGFGTLAGAAAGAYAGHKMGDEGFKDPDAEYKKAQKLKQQQNKDVTEGDDYSAVTGAITRRIITQHPEVLAKYGPAIVSQAIDEIADFVGDVDEIGSSDVSGWVSQVIRSLGRFAPVRDEGVAEGHTEVKDKQGKVVSWKDDSEWHRAEKNKQGQPKDPRGVVTHLSDVARRKTADQQGMAEAEVDSDGYSMDHADSGEYDYEGDQARDQMNTIVRAARRLDGLLDDNENMPEWVQMKVTLAADYLDTAADYIESNQEPELEEGWKEKLGGAALAGAMALGAGGAQARVMPGDDPGINRLTGKPIASQQATDTTPTQSTSSISVAKPQAQYDVDTQTLTYKGKQYKWNSDAQATGQGEVVTAPSMAVGSRSMGSTKVELNPNGTYTRAPANESQEKVGDMDADKFDAAMARLKQLAGAGPLKTVYDPTKRVYRNVPVAVQPKK